MPSAPARVLPRPDQGEVTARVGLVGAGQLARMTHQASVGLGVEVVALGDPGAASAAGTTLLEGSGDSAADLAALAERVDVISYEWEQVDLDALQALADAGAVVRPAPEVARLAVDKGHGRRRLAELGLPVPDHALVADAAEARAAVARLGLPLVLKAPTGGYDGRGVAFYDEEDAVVQAVEAAPGPMLAERHVALDGELAVLVARRPSGELATYPVVATRQEDGICVDVVAPAPIPPETERAAVALVEGLAEAIGLEGLMAVELFVEGGELLVNELALRPHNTGHLTMEACATSQFEQLLRAVLDWPLGDPGLVAPAAAMVNLLGPVDGGDPAHRLPEALAVRGAHVHLYGKLARPGRKLGHVTALGGDPGDALATARRAVEALA